MAAKYSETITDRAGSVLSGAIVQLLDNTGALVTTYTDPSLTTGAATERSANDNGLVELYVADGVYTVVQTFKGEQVSLRNVQLYDLSKIAATSDAAVANKAQASAIGIAGDAEDMGAFTSDLIADGSSAKEALESLAENVLPLADQTAAEIGIANDATMSPLRVKQATDAQVLSPLVSTSPDAGAAMVGFDVTASYAAATLGAKAGQTVAVTDAPFLADATGAVDAVSAFSQAAQATYVSDYIGGALESSLPRPMRGYVRVPAGNYALDALVDTGGRDIVWLLDPAAVIDNPENINGQILRGDGRATLQNPFSISDYATAQVATIGGSYADKPAPVLGASALQTIADYADRDAVALIGAAYSTSALISTTDATYTATDVTITSPSDDVLKRLRRGMIIDTKHTTRCTALVSSWLVSGGDLVITVDEWREQGGSSAVTPADGTGLYISRTSKIWGGNFVANLLDTGDVEEAVGIETTVYNSRGDSSATIGNTTNRVVGNYVYSAGPYKAQSGFQFAGAAQYGFTALDSENGFYSISAAGKSGTAFIAQGYTVVLRGVNSSNQQTFSVSSSGGIEMGNLSASSTVTLDFHSSGNNIDYDSRISATGGSSTVAQGVISFAAAAIGFSGVPRPNSDNTINLGAASFRWAVIYAGTGTINTSDRDKKDLIGSIPDEWLDAWGDVQFQRYKFKDAIAAKGDDARWHIGLIAQDVEEAFAARGLDAFEIGLLCKDQVIETIMVDQPREVPIMEDYEEEVIVSERAGDAIILRKVVRTAEREKTETLPLLDDEGKPVMEAVIDPADPHGEARIMVPAVRDVPVMQTIIEQVPEQRETDEWIYGLRYEEALAMEAAWARREIARIGASA